MKAKTLSLKSSYLTLISSFATCSMILSELFEVHKPHSACIFKSALFTFKIVHICSIYCDYIHPHGPLSPLSPLLLTPVFPQLVHLLLAWCLFFFSFDPLSLIRVACMSMCDRVFPGAWQFTRGYTAEENAISPTPRFCPSFKRK